MRKLSHFIADSWEAIGVFAGVAIMVYEFVTQLYAGKELSLNNTVWLGLGLFVFFGVLAIIKANRKAREAQDSKSNNRVESKTRGGQSLKAQEVKAAVTMERVEGDKLTNSRKIGDVRGGQVIQGDINIYPENKTSSSNTSDTMEDYKEMYQPHQVKEDETWESISEQEYGSRKFVKRIQEANNGMIYLPPKGSYINIPTIRITSKQRENGKYIRIMVVNSYREKPALCKAIIRKMELYKEGEWTPVDTSDDGALSWHLGGSDNNGWKEVFLGAESINVARLHELSLSDKIVFTHLVDKYRVAGRYRMLIEVIYKFSDKPRVEKWYGYVDRIDGKMEITEMEDVNQWK